MLPLGIAPNLSLNRPLGGGAGVHDGSATEFGDAFGRDGQSIG
jgi:hypothetical protein